MLTSKQRAFLRKLSQGEEPLLIIGKEGPGAESRRHIEDMLPKRELIKVSLLKSCPTEVKEVAADLAAATGAEVVSVVGRRFVLYRHSRKLAEKGKAIVLPPR